MEGKECGVQEREKCEEENPCQNEEGALAWNTQLCLGKWQWGSRGWRQPQGIQRVRKESERTSETPQGTWLGGAQKGSLWLCYAGPLADKRKSGISGKRHRPKPIPWEKNSWGKLGKEEDEEDEPQIERRSECTDLGLDLGVREKQVICHASALALAMTDEARREAEM